MITMNVVNKRNGKKGEAEQVNNDKWVVTFEDGSQTEVKSVTLRKWYQKIEVVAETAAAIAGETEQGDEPAPEIKITDVTDADTTLPLTFEQWLVEKHGIDSKGEKFNDDWALANLDHIDSEEAASEFADQLDQQYNEYLMKGDADLAAKLAEKQPEPAAKKSAAPKPEKQPLWGQYETAGKLVRLLEHVEVPTAKGKKIVDEIGVGDVTLKILQYGAYIMDVRVIDASGTELYRSSKLSVSDALTEGLKFDEVTMKSLRSVITLVRKFAAVPVAERGAFTDAEEHEATSGIDAE